MLQWMIAHDHSLQDLIVELTEMQFSDPEDDDRISTPVSELFDEWVADVGFGSDSFCIIPGRKLCTRFRALVLKFGLARPSGESVREQNRIFIEWSNAFWLQYSFLVMWEM